MAQSGSKPLADECFTATFGLWNALKNAHKGRGLVIAARTFEGEYSFWEVQGLRSELDQLGLIT